MNCELENGIQAGRQWSPETTSFTDPETNAEIKQLTQYRSHSHQLYITNSSWFNQGENVLFGSDRTGTPNLFSVAPGTGRITQLTDLPEGEFERSLPRPVLRTFAGGASINPEFPEAYFWYDSRLVGIDLETLTLRSLYQVPDGYRPFRTSVTADGAYICTGITEIASKTSEFSGAEKQRREPHSQIFRVAVDDGNIEILHEEDNWLGHPNASPTDPDLMTFAREGPWEEVDCRIWVLDMSDGDVWKIRSRETGEGQYRGVGHEHWMDDGEYIGYHGHSETGEAFYGMGNPDGSGFQETIINSSLVQLEYPDSKGADFLSHFHQTDEYIVSDCTRRFPYLVLWKLDRETGALSKPRKLAFHGGSFQHPRLHVHPRFSPEGDRILYSSNRTEYQELYQVKIPDFDDLPVAVP